MPPALSRGFCYVFYCQLIVRVVKFKPAAERFSKIPNQVAFGIKTGRGKGKPAAAKI
jgi:hypothetical protein